MSTKTSIKRIAAVAALALTLGGFSAVSAFATAGTGATAAMGTGATAAGTVTAVTATFGTTTRIAANKWDTPVSLAITGTTIGANDTITLAEAHTLGVGVTGTVSLADKAPVATYVSATSATVSATLRVTAATNLNIANVLAAVGTYTSTISANIDNTAAVGATPAVVTVPALATTGTFGSAGTVTASGSGGALVQAVNGQATVDFINGTGDTSYTVTSSGVGTMLSASATTTPANLNGTTPAGGFTYTPVTTRQDLTVTATSAVAGVQTISFQPIGANGAPGIPVLATITWGGGVTFSPTSTVVRQGSAVPAKVIAGDAQGATSATVLGYTTALDAVPQSAVKTAGTAGSVIEVVTLNSNGSAAYEGNTVSATITGSGLILASTTAPTVATALTVTGSARTSKVVLDSSHNVAYIYVNADGTAGTGTVSVSVTDGITGVSTVVATKTVTFYGSVATLTASVNYSIGRAGYTTGAAATTLDSSSTGSPLAASNTAPAFNITAKDSNGNAVTTASAPSVSSSDTTVVTGGACALDDGSSSTYSSSSNGVGVYNCSFTSAPNAVSGGKATLTIKVLNPADATGTTYITTTIPVTVGGKVAKTVLNTDAASYSAGQAMTITITATDSAGNPVYDGAASTAVSANKSVIGIPAASFFVGGVVTTDTSKGVKTAYAPATGGDFILTETDSALLTSTVTATVADVASGAAQAAVDAANEATDAANAATDAANNAMDSADAAQQAALDAGDKADAALAAVTDLATKVSAIATQIASLSALVKKIAAKVKA